MSGSGLLPAIPPSMGLRIAHGACGFEEGEALGETVGRRAERCDVLRYHERKRDNAMLIAERSPDHADHARSVARAHSIAIDDLRGGLHENEALSSVAPTATALPYPFTHHRTMEEVKESSLSPSDAGREASASLGSAAVAATAGRPLAAATNAETDHG